MYKVTKQTRALPVCCFGSGMPKVHVSTSSRSDLEFAKELLPIRKMKHGFSTIVLFYLACIVNKSDN